MTNLWKRNPKDANSMHETQKTLSNMHQTVTHLTSHTVSHIPIQSVILIVSPSWARVQDFPFPHLPLYYFSTSPPHLASLVLPFSSLRPFEFCRRWADSLIVEQLHGSSNISSVLCNLRCPLIPTFFFAWHY